MVGGTRWAQQAVQVRRHMVRFPAPPEYGDINVGHKKRAAAGGGGVLFRRGGELAGRRKRG